MKINFKNEKINNHHTFRDFYFLLLQKGRNEN